MAKDHSFDLVSKVDMQEFRNAIQLAQKELLNRFDFKGTSAKLEFEEEKSLIKLVGDNNVQLKSIIDVLENKMIHRKVSLKALKWDEVETLPSGGAKQQGQLQQGLTSEKAKEIVKEIKALGLKVQPRIDGEQVRVSAKQIDDLQAVVAAVKEKDFGVPLTTENYR